MESVKRVVVYLSRDKSVLQCAKFLQGITGHYAAGSPDRATVNCGLDQNRFIISDRPFSGSRKVELQLLEAGLRELREETGLNLQGANLPWSILGLWESAFPPLLSRGLPRRHHIVVYLLVLSNETHQELQEKLRPDEREVSACVWLDPEIAEQIVAAKDGVKDCGRKSPGLQTSIMITEVGGRSRDLALQTLLNTAPADGEDTERVSTGTKYALHLWLETLRPGEVT